MKVGAAVVGLLDGLKVGENVGPVGVQVGCIVGRWEGCDVGGQLGVEG